MIFKISPILQNPRRKLIVSSQEINLNITDDSNRRENTIFVLMVKESSGSAGGRGGGSGMRKIDKILAFKMIEKSMNKFMKLKIRKRLRNLISPTVQ